MVLARAETLIAELPDPASSMDVYLALSRVMALLGDGHIVVERPPAKGKGSVLGADREAGAVLLDVAVQSVPDNGLRVFWSGALGITEHDVLRRINGGDALDLFDSVMDLEGGEPALKRRLAMLDFSEALWDLGIVAPFDIEGTISGKPGRVLVSKRKEVIAPEKTPDEPDLGITLDTNEAKFPIIDFYSMKADPASFYRRVEAIFTRLHEADSRGLIIDLRTNGGGNSLLGDILLAFITDTPYRPFARQEMRASPECRAYYARLYSRDDYFNRAMAGLRDGERAAWRAEPHAPQPTTWRFTGPVAVLIGPGTFSSSNIVANAIQDYGLAELIGRDTAEIPNNFGMPCEIVLPHTRITLDVPSNYFVRANGDEADHSDVHPNIVVARDETAEKPGERDVEAAVGWIEKTIAQSPSPSVPSVKSPVSPTPPGQNEMP
jgi:hypothetical protein